MKLRVKIIFAFKRLLKDSLGNSCGFNADDTKEKNILQNEDTSLPLCAPPFPPSVATAAF